MKKRTNNAKKSQKNARKKCKKIKKTFFKQISLSGQFSAVSFCSSPPQPASSSSSVFSSFFAWSVA